MRRKHILNSLWIILMFSINNGFSQEGSVQSDSVTYTLADTMMARNLLEEVKILIKKRELKEAEDKLNQVSEIYKQTIGEETLEIAEVWYQKGSVYYYLASYNQARDAFLSSLNIQLKILGSNDLGVAKSYNALGLIYGNLGEFDKALDYHQNALIIRINALGENHPDVASSYNNFGNIYYSLGELDKALDYHQNALMIRVNSLGENHADVASSYNNVGNIYFSFGELDKAIDFQKNALLIKINFFGKNHPTVASTYNNIGVSYESKGELDKAIEYKVKALQIRLNYFGENHPDVASSLHNLGIAYDLKGEFDKAINYHLKALQIRLLSLGKNHLDVSSSLNAIGVVYGVNGELKKALDYHQKALQTRLNSLGENHPDIANTYNSIGFIYYSMRETEKALEYYQKALEVRIKIFGKNHPDVSLSIFNIGELNYLLENYFEALVNYQNAIFATNYKKDNFQNINSFEYLIGAFKRKSKTEQILYQKSKNIQNLVEGIESINEAISALHYETINFNSEKSKKLWQDRNHGVYEQAIDLHLLQANELNQAIPEKLFDFAESSKAAILQSQIKETDALHYANIPDSLLQKEYDLRIDITYNEKRRQEKMNEGLSETDTLVLGISSQLFDLNQEYDALKQKFETDYPEYYKLKYDLSTVSLKEVQNKLLEKDQTLLEYFVGDSSIYLFVVKPDDYIVEEVKKDFDLDSLVATLQSGLYDYYKTPASDRTDELYEQSVSQYAAVAHQLYGKLIEPVKDKLTENLVIIPDGILGYVPFEALLSSTPTELNNFKTYPYLVRDHQVSYNYSATLWREMKEKKHLKNPEKSLLAFAPFYEGSYTYLDEEFQDFDFDSLAIALDLPIEDEYVSRKDFTALPASGEEVSTISKLWKGAYFVNADATEERFNQEAGNYKIVHLSTHGVADSRVGDYSYLAFAEIPDSIENELLYVRDLYNIQLNADLVVLSACETGVGKLQKGEGIISLARAFAYAGAKSIVTTLWTVNDSATKNLMQAFYSGLKKGQTKDKALQNAKLALMKKGDEKAHPFFWAGFIPVGDMTPIK